MYSREGFLHYIGIPSRRETNYIYNKKMEYRARERNPSLFTLGLSHHMKGVEELMRIFREVLNRKSDIILKTAVAAHLRRCLVLIYTSKPRPRRLESAPLLPFLASPIV